MKLGADQTGLLLTDAARWAKDECLIVAEVDVTRIGKEDSLTARVLGCRGFDRIFRQRGDARWEALSVKLGNKLFPPTEREEYTEEDWKSYCACDSKPVEDDDDGAYAEERALERAQEMWAEGRVPRSRTN